MASPLSLPRLSACSATVLLLALASCEPAPPLRPPALVPPAPPGAYAAGTDAPAVDAEAHPARDSWASPVEEVAPDLDDAQAAARAARAVLLTLPEGERRRVLGRFLPPFGPEPAPPVAASPVGEGVVDGGLAPPAPPAAPREEVNLLAVMRELCAAQGSRELALAAFFVGPERMARVRSLLRRPPERLDLGELARRLRWYEQPALRYAREARRWAILYGLAWPVERLWRVTSGFGPRFHPILGGLFEHRGIDIGVPVGTEVRAPAAGEVVRVRRDRVNGQWIAIDHGNGVLTQYCHLSQVEVKRGQRVKAGEGVARSGDTGRVTGPHLHYQVKLSGSFVDPLGIRAPASLVAEPVPFVPPPPPALGPSAQR